MPVQRIGWIDPVVDEDFSQHFGIAFQRRENVFAFFPRLIACSNFAWEIDTIASGAWIARKTYQTLIACSFQETGKTGKAEVVFVKVGGFALHGLLDQTSEHGARFFSLQPLECLGQQGKCLVFANGFDLVVRRLIGLGCPFSVTALVCRFLQRFVEDKLIAHGNDESTGAAAGADTDDTLVHLLEPLDQGGEVAIAAQQYKCIEVLSGKRPFHRIHHRDSW